MGTLLYSLGAFTPTSPLVTVIDMVTTVLMLVLDPWLCYIPSYINAPKTTHRYHGYALGALLQSLGAITPTSPPVTVINMVITMLVLVSDP